MEDKKILNKEELKTKMKQLTDNGASMDELKAFVAEQGITINEVDTKNGPLSDEELEKVSGGIEVDKEAFQYDVIKRYYFQKGAQLAFILFIYFIPSPTGYDVIKYIEWEISQGNLGYMYNGVYYSTPYDDPEYDDTWCI